MDTMDNIDGMNNTVSEEDHLHPAFVIKPGYVDGDVTIDMVEPSIYENSTYLGNSCKHYSHPYVYAKQNEIGCGHKLPFHFNGDGATPES